MASKERQDSPDNDIIDLSKPEAGAADKNEDDFILWKDGSTTKAIRPFGLWATNSTLWVAHKPLTTNDVSKIYAYSMMWHTNGTKRYLKGARDESKDFDTLHANENHAPTGIWSDGETMWVSVSGGKIHAFNLPKAGATILSDSGDASLATMSLSGVRLNPGFSSDNRIYTALVDHTVSVTTVTATPNDSMAAVDIFSGTRGTTRRTARRGPQAALQEGYNIIAVDVTAEDGSIQTYLVFVTKSEAPPVSGGPLPQPQSFQLSTTSSASQPGLTGSAAGLKEWKSRLISAEPLQNGGVRFVFLVSAEELKIETTPDLLGGNWRPLPEDEIKILRESNGNGPDRLTIILPKAEGKQRFLRLTPLP